MTATTSNAVTIVYGTERWIVDKNDIYAGTDALRLAIEYVESIDCKIGPLSTKLKTDLDVMRRALTRLRDCKQGEYREGKVTK